MTKISFENSYAKLPDDFYSQTHPTPVDEPTLFKFNTQLAKNLGLSALESDADKAHYFSGNKILEGSEPIAMAYSGHQFGHFSPKLGDGRAILLGEVKNKNGISCDIQLKGSGQTPWSRSGDGRSALGPVIREYIISEAMHKLGVPTTRALAAVTTGENVLRDKLTPGGILTRVASSFVRVGTFEYFSTQGKNEALKTLADYVIDRHYPEAKTAKRPYVELLRLVMDAQARLIAKWMSLGFIHGVMNTDNVSIVGETIDYGPCAFMDEFAHNKVFSSIDREGRYAYQNQPQIGQWNLIRFAECLLPLFEEYVTPEQGEAEKVVVMYAQDTLNQYEGLYKHYWLNEMRQKIGIAATERQLSPEEIFEKSLKAGIAGEETASKEIDELAAAKAHQQNANDHALIVRLLNILQAGKADFTLMFTLFSQDINKQDKVRELFENPDDFDIWVQKWKLRLAEENTTAEEQITLMQSVNPVYIPRNHQVEAAIRAAEDLNDFSKFDELHAVLQNPYTVQEGMESYTLPPKPEEVVHNTFCGT